MQLPEDFYLRELSEVPADDLPAVAQLFRSFGLLFDLEHAELDLRDHDPEERKELEALALLTPPRRGCGGVHRDQVRLHLEIAQDAITTWVACQSPGGLEELVEPEITDKVLEEWRARNTHAEPPWPHSLDHLREMLIQFRIERLSDAVNGALSKFSIGVGDLAARRPTVYSVAFLQLYNHLSEDATIRECANETCRRTFVRQRGRAAYGQNRTSGIKYCTRECARAQAQREHRRRRKQTTP
ncbi:hypothetical protein [Streptomyces sp. enrichment culture]|uniref:hypothetical protein n=1 Tax=Streptomyces sp. enrichment culture TaxID=1795815 RepID=UPI003F5765CA